MPFKLIKHLDERAADFAEFRTTLRDAPSQLARAENAFRAYERARAEIFEAAPNMMEKRGMCAGITMLAPPIIQQKVVVKTTFEAEKISKETAEFAIKNLSAAADRVRENLESMKEAHVELRGKIQGFYWAACASLDEVEAAVQSKRADDERRAEDGGDPLGWGTKNGQRPVTPISAGKRNGSGKKPRRKRAVKKKPKPSTPPDAN